MSNIESFLHKSFQSLESSILLSIKEISYFLVKASKSISYVETLGNHADSLHRWIKSSYEEDFKRSFELQVRKAIKNLGVSFASLAIDLTSEHFYGDTRNLHIFNTSGESYQGEFKFAVVSLIVRNKQIPLMALPMIVGQGSAKPVIELLKYCKTLFKKIRFAVFDRGFYIAELIDYLEAEKIKYLMLVPEKKGRIHDYVEQTGQFGKFSHTMEYSKEKSKWKPQTTIVVCRGIDDFDWIFATNINFQTRSEIIIYYKKRWQIETNFRVEDEARIKSKSTNYLIRYFYFLVSLLFHLLWVVNKNIGYYVPFKKYLDIVEQEFLFGWLGIRQI